jgi:hypothetical protein
VIENGGHAIGLRRQDAALAAWFDAIGFHESTPALAHSTVKEKRRHVSAVQGSLCYQSALFVRTRQFPSIDNA